MFVKKPKVALRSILRTATITSDSQVFPTDSSTVRDDTTGRLIRTPAEVIAEGENLPIKALTLDPTLPLGAPFPWRSKAAPTLPDAASMAVVCISTEILQQALRRTPNHNAVNPDGVPGLVLKHMPQAFHKTIHLLFQSMAITGITPPLMAKKPYHTPPKKRTPPYWTITTRSLLLTRYTNYRQRVLSLLLQSTAKAGKSRDQSKKTFVRIGLALGP
jgi:hypothetical protein